MYLCLFLKINYVVYVYIKTNTCMYFSTALSDNIIHEVQLIPV